MKSSTRTIDELVSVTPFARPDVEAAVASIISERLIVESDNLFTLRLEIDSLLTIANFCINSPLEIDFMLSAYYRRARETLLISHVSSKYLVTLTPEDRDTIRKILAISPTALARVTQGEAESFRNTEQHIKELKLPEVQSMAIRASNKRQLIEILTHDLCHDHNEKNITALTSSQGVITVMAELTIKLAARNESFLKLHARRFAVIAKAESPIRAGQLVFTTGPAPLLEAGDSMMAMEEFDQAISSFDMVISQFPGTEAALTATNNKAICYLRQNKVEEAIAVLVPFARDEAPYNTWKTVRQFAIKNLSVCYAQKGDSVSAASTLELLEAIS